MSMVEYYGKVVVKTKKRTIKMVLPTDNEEPMKMYGEKAILGLENSTNIEEVMDVIVNSFYLPWFEEDGEKTDLEVIANYYDYDDIYPKLKKDLEKIKFEDVLYVALLTSDSDNCANWAKYDFVKKEKSMGEKIISLDDLDKLLDLD